MSTPASSVPHDPGPPQPAPSCPTCNAPIAGDQRYCLNCGHRLAEPRVDYRRALHLVAEPPPRPLGAVRERDPRTAMIVLASIATVVLAVGVGIVIGRGDGSTTTASKPTVITVAGAGTSTPAAGTTAAGTPVSTSGAGAKVGDAWPAGASGWTVELSSLDNNTATAASVSAAESAASAKGATNVAVLNGSDHGGTPTGKYVIYSGRLSSKAQADAAVHRLAKKFPGALVLHVTPKGAPAGTPATASNAGASQAAHARNLSGNAYVKASQKLPTTVGTGGSAPPVDHKKPGGGSSGTCIGC